VSEYHKIVSQLPLPTQEQTEAFLKHVIGAHSWYKHLPFLPPGGIFVFYLDPQAGREILRHGGRNEFMAMFGGYTGVTRQRLEIQDLTDKKSARITATLSLDSNLIITT
jgi:hypothetical protein